MNSIAGVLRIECPRCGRAHTIYPLPVIPESGGQLDIPNCPNCGCHQVEAQRIEADARKGDA
jgi:predicted RNA-binding Zn-ribbon protein involved in translation (DUF1610 family)